MKGTGLYKEYAYITTLSLKALQPQSMVFMYVLIWHGIQAQMFQLI